MAQLQGFDALHDIIIEIASRQDVARTLITLSSAALLFTITFASSLIKPTSSRSLRYTIGFCWLAFVISLILSLLSLWFSIGAQNFPALVMTKIKELKEIAATDRAKLGEFVANLWQTEIVPDQRRSRRL